MALEKSIFELAVDELLERQQLTKLELRERFKRTKPFRMEEVPQAEMLYEYNTMTPEKFNALLNTYGEDAMGDFVYNMEMLKKKKQGGEVNA